MRLSFALTRISTVFLTSACAAEAAKTPNSTTHSNLHAPALDFGKCAAPSGPCDEADFSTNGQCGTNSNCLCESEVLSIMSLCWDCLIAEYAIRIPQDGSGLGRGVWGAVFSERVNSCRDAGHGMKFLPGSVVLNQTLVSKGASTIAPTSTSTSELKPASVNLTRATSKAPSNRPSSTNPMVPYTVTAGANRTLATKFPKTMSLKMSISTANVSAAATYHRDTTTFRAVIVIESTTRTSYVSATTAGPTSARKANAASRLINFPRFNLWAETGVSLLSLRWWAGVLTKYVPSATAIDYVPSATNTTSDKSSYSSLAASARFPANGLAVSVCLAMTVCCGSTFDMSRICHRDCQCICESGMFPLLEQQ